jgi:hypothetical protein
MYSNIYILLAQCSPALTNWVVRCSQNCERVLTHTLASVSLRGASSRSIVL